jgi:intraflagellar transport protein 46
MDHGGSPHKSAAKVTKAKTINDEKDSKNIDNRNSSQSIQNRPFDEALEFSHSGSDDSVDTVSERKNEKNSKANLDNMPKTNNSKPAAPSIAPNTQSTQQQKVQGPANNKTQTQFNKSQQQNSKTDDESSEGDGHDEDNGEESYDNIEGAYNSKDYQHLDVTGEIRDLFQYIERFRPQEMELDTTLKCFIPEYIPSIGEMDACIKVPRPDGRDDELGLKVLDEPSSNQSDPTVLELQLRAMSKKMQYGDVVVRSIENANKNPNLIDKWIQSINDLHRTKPPPQVHYRKNMPDIDQLMDVWPEEFESLLGSVQLPSPDLELSLAEYAKSLCAILDIPTYENPVESLHLMFTLYTDFRNNPHFQNIDEKFV